MPVTLQSPGIVKPLAYSHVHQRKISDRGDRDLHAVPQQLKLVLALPGSSNSQQAAVHVRQHTKREEVSRLV